MPARAHNSSSKFAPAPACSVGIGVDGHAQRRVSSQPSASGVVAWEIRVSASPVAMGRRRLRRAASWRGPINPFSSRNDEQFAELTISREMHAIAICGQGFESARFRRLCPCDRWFTRVRSDECILRRGRRLVRVFRWHLLRRTPDVESGARLRRQATHQVAHIWLRKSAQRATPPPSTHSSARTGQSAPPRFPGSGASSTLMPLLYHAHFRARKTPIARFLARN